jgi:hypothetical protein
MHPWPERGEHGGEYFLLDAKVFCWMLDLYFCWAGGLQKEK